MMKLAIRTNSVKTFKMKKKRPPSITWV